MSAPSDAPTRRPRTGAIIVLVIGAILTVTGPIFGVLAGSFAMIPGALDLADNTIEVSPTGTITLGDGESVYLLGPVADLDQLDHESCTATGPNDEPATVVFAPASALNTLVSGTRYESFAQVTASTAGTYDITCQTGGIPVVTAPPFTLGGLIGPLAWWSIAGIAVSLIGIVMVIIGIVRLAPAPRTT
ncbi:hypothetical protein [Microbacterium sp. 18062]|uniref:hypothetical protein n=1 Tax=Microbacterium sp. 18062 TaxID=2681410 RepID=UPI001358EFDA|nr:hypothetical protein [Microbacterium sp. 18062]